MDYQLSHALRLYVRLLFVLFLCAFILLRVSYLFVHHGKALPVRNFVRDLELRLGVALVWQYKLLVWSVFSLTLSW